MSQNRPGPGGVYLVLGGVPGPGDVPGHGSVPGPREGGVPGPGEGGVPGLGGCTWSGGLYLVWGVYLVRGGTWSGGCTWSGGVCQVHPPGTRYTPRDQTRYTPPWTESQTPVKTLPWPNFVAAGKKPFHFSNFAIFVPCSSFDTVVIRNKCLGMSLLYRADENDTQVPDKNLNILGLFNER